MITNKDISIDSENGKITLNGNKYDLGTQGEIDTAVKDVYSVMGQMGAKNLIPYPYYRESGYSSNGMTTTYDSDGVMTINKVAGSSTAYFALTYTDDNYCLKPNTKYKLLFELENANQLAIFLKYGDTDIVLINKKSTGKYVVDFTTPQTLQGRENLGISAAASDTETNAKVKLMIMLASDTDETYQPYAMTNKQLMETIGDLTQTGVTGATVAAQLEALDTDLGNKIKLITPETQYYTSTSTNLEYTGVSVACPAGHLYIVRAKCDWSNASTQSIAVSDSSSDASSQRLFANSNSACATFMLAAGETAYIWGKWAVASRNAVLVNITDITL